ncbi:hypothetical protein M3A96_05855 [Helcobacillus massiliensis]|uniref:hypothetical protein n=1 Tax=Helcobacillus TaxID=1161125 RepID=UPI001EF419AC|nr:MULTISPECIES: hypothetical protein [Helcobacillus]MCG7426675.1 hypothetical protein [Helcobacillus sp. ACRRO]MCT1557635.1 hypothetical protein [Helcobacillus massiliensis]MCT2035907.1 hypothetical protein [Helcobacillus massiliensis]MCT2331823.1 hypothetical protein [Helcobacillus massiliensis]
MDELISQSRDYTSNDSGHLAWDVALLIRAALIAWEIEGGERRLDQSVRWAERLLATTDEARGAVDWQGLSRPLWSAGSRYNPGSAEVGRVGDRALHLQASGRAVQVRRTSDSTVTVAITRSDGSLWESPEASLLPQQANYLPDLLSTQGAALSAQLRGLTEEADLRGALSDAEIPLEPQQAAHLVHTGMICRALLMVADVLPDDSTRFISAAERALRAHLHLLGVTDPGTDGIPFRLDQAYDFPSRRVGVALPHNQVADAATCLMKLSQLLDDPFLETIGRRMIATEVADLSTEKPWRYYPQDSEAFTGVERNHPLYERRVTPVTRPEDSSHVTIRIRALSDWRDLVPELVADSDLERAGSVFQSDYLTSGPDGLTVRWTPDPSIAPARCGYADSFSGAWTRLAPWHQSITTLVNTLAYQHPPDTVFGATVLSAAEIWQMNTAMQRTA